MYPGIYDYIQQVVPGAMFSQGYYQTNPTGTFAATKDWTTQGAKHILIHSIQWTLPVGTALNTIAATFTDQFGNIILNQVNVGNFTAVNHIPYFVLNSSAMLVNVAPTVPGILFTVGYQYITLPAVQSNN